MKKNKLLFVTSIDDSHSDYIINILNERGEDKKVVRINTENFVEDCNVSFTELDFNIHIKDSDRKISRNEILSVWFRRPKDFLYKADNEKLTVFVHKQSNALLRGIYFSTHDSAKWINPLTSLHRARIKLQQLMLAKEVGFNVPKTLVSNNPKDVLEFIKTIDQVSTKSLDEPNYQSDKHFFPLFNRRLKKDFIEKHYMNVAVCPTLFQEYIEKKSDIRVVVVGEKLFSFEIHSQENKFSIEDFRGISPSLLRHELIKLPSLLENNILTFMKQQNLTYSSFDFVKSRNNEYYFIENNANGQWLWLELNTGIKISDAFIKILQHEN